MALLFWTVPPRPSFLSRWWIGCWFCLDFFFICVFFPLFLCVTLTRPCFVSTSYRYKFFFFWFVLLFLFPLLSSTFVCLLVWHIGHVDGSLLFFLVLSDILCALFSFSVTVVCCCSYCCCRRYSSSPFQSFLLSFHPTVSLILFPSLPSFNFPFLKFIYLLIYFTLKKIWYS